MLQWEYLEVAYAPGPVTVLASNGRQFAVRPQCVPDQFGWVSVTDALNCLGDEGWELVATVQEIGVTKLFLKRPCPSRCNGSVRY